MAVPLAVAAAFLGMNLVAVWSILQLSRRGGQGKRQSSRSSTAQPDAAVTPAENAIPASQLLGWEFEYARVTASEAMHDRHTMVNYYLLIVGIAVSATAGALSAQVPIPAWLGAVLLWLLCGVGWLYFFKLIRLRQAWYDSAQAMNQIKEFCIRHNREFAPAELRTAFRWQASSLPIENKPWTLFFFSAMLIGFVSTSAYFVGGLVLGLQLLNTWAWLAIMSGLAAVFLGAHVYFYFAFLQQPVRDEVG